MIRFGIIGCGSVSQTYLYELSRNINSEVVAIVDTDITKAHNNAELFGVANVYSDYKEMLNNEHIDAVIICTPHFAHYEQAIACAKKGLHILCEKPLATSLEDIKKMIDECSKMKFSVMLQRRFYPNSIAVANAIKSGALGSIIEVSLDFTCYKSPDFYNNWRGKKISGGGVLISQALHRIDQLSFFFGEAQYVEGITKIIQQEIEVEDYAKGEIYFSNDIVANIEANNSSGDPDTISIIKIKGSMGEIVLSDDKTIEWRVKGMPLPSEADINRIPTKYRPEYYGPCHEEVINDFVDAIFNDRQPIITGVDALPSMEIIFGFYKSAEMKKRIAL